ncbi:MAG TPA: YIP1 family protein [Gemmatimonadaceae bacterium]|jgi:hypothetical protein
MTDLSTSERGAGYGPGSATPAPATPPAAWWEDFIDIFYAPSSVFARRANSGFAIPMLVVTLLVGGIFLANSGVLAPVFDAEFARGMAAAARKNPGLTPDAIERGRGIAMIFAKIGAFVFLPVGMLLTGLALWIVGKLFDSRQTLAAAIMVASFAFVPRVVEGVVNGVQGLLMDPASLNGRYRLSLGVARFFDPDVASPVLLAFVGRLDLFTIWVTVLLAIGLAVTGKISRQKAAAAAAIVWFVGALFPVLGALRQ